MAAGRNKLAVAAGVIVLAGLTALALLAPRPSSPAGPTIGGPFALTNDSGKPVTDQDYRGKFLLVYFGYTHCPDACPTTLSDIAASLDKLPAPSRDKVRVLFITVDPERDTPSVMRNYVSAFGPEFIGLTGSQAQLDPVEAEFHVYAQKHPLKGGDYAMDHSSIIYMIGQDGKFDGLLDDDLAPAQMAEKLQSLGA